MNHVVKVIKNTLYNNLDKQKQQRIKDFNMEVDNI